MATATNDKPVKIGQLPIVKKSILDNASQMDKGVVGGYSGTFPLTTATKDGIYLVPQTGKFYVCETAYNGTQITLPNSNFVELSVWKNHDRLTNLNKRYLIETGVSGDINYEIYSDGWCRQFSFNPLDVPKTELKITFPKAYKDYEYLVLVSTLAYSVAAFWKSGNNSITCDFESTKVGKVTFLVEGFIW